MKIKSEIIEQEKTYLEEIEKKRLELNQEARNCFQTARDIVESMNIEWAEYIGKRVKITCNNRFAKVYSTDTHVCYFEGFMVESKGWYPSVPTIRPALFKEKKDGSESKMKYHLPYTLDEIIEIELAE
jgi:hypothetical protein